jgi:ABC-type Fe3+/spermidine/putrescine transport system ATPase subunit
MKEQFLKTFSEQDWEANLKLEEELDALRTDLGRTWLMVTHIHRYQ